MANPTTDQFTPVPVQEHGESWVKTRVSPEAVQSTYELTHGADVPSTPAERYSQLSWDDQGKIGYTQQPQPEGAPIGETVGAEEIVEPTFRNIGEAAIRQSGYRVDSDQIRSRKLSTEDEISLNWLPQNVNVQHRPPVGTVFELVDSDGNNIAQATYRGSEDWGQTVEKFSAAGFKLDPNSEQFQNWRPDIDFVQSVSPVEFSAGRGDPVISIERRAVDPADGVLKWIPDQITLDHRFTLNGLYSDGDVRVVDTEQNRLALGLLEGTDVDALIRNMMFPQFGTVQSGAPAPVVITADDVVSPYDGSKIEKGTVANLGAPDPVATTDPDTGKTTIKTVVIPNEDELRRLVTEGRARFLDADDASDMQLAGLISMNHGPAAGADYINLVARRAAKGATFGLSELGMDHLWAALAEVPSGLDVADGVVQESDQITPEEVAQYSRGLNAEHPIAGAVSEIGGALLPALLAPETLAAGGGPGTAGLVRTAAGLTPVGLSGRVAGSALRTLEGVPALSSGIARVGTSAGVWGITGAAEGSLMGAVDAIKSGDDIGDAMLEGAVSGGALGTAGGTVGGTLQTIMKRSVSERLGKRVAKRLGIDPKQFKDAVNGTDDATLNTLVDSVMSGDRQLIDTEHGLRMVRRAGEGLIEDLEGSDFQFGDNVVPAQLVAGAIIESDLANQELLLGRLRPLIASMQEPETPAVGSMTVPLKGAAKLRTGDLLAQQRMGEGALNLGEIATGGKPVNPELLVRALRDDASNSVMESLNSLPKQIREQRAPYLGRPILNSLGIVDNLTPRAIRVNQNNIRSALSGGELNVNIAGDIAVKASAIDHLMTDHKDAVLETLNMLYGQRRAYTVPTPSAGRRGIGTADVLSDREAFGKAVDDAAELVVGQHPELIRDFKRTFSDQPLMEMFWAPNNRWTSGSDLPQTQIRYRIDKSGATLGNSTDDAAVKRTIVSMLNRFGWRPGEGDSVQPVLAAAGEYGEAAVMSAMAEDGFKQWLQKPVAEGGLGIQFVQRKPTRALYSELPKIRSVSRLGVSIERPTTVVNMPEVVHSGEGLGTFYNGMREELSAGRVQQASERLYRINANRLRKGYLDTEFRALNPGQTIPDVYSPDQMLELTQMMSNAARMKMMFGLKKLSQELKQGAPKWRAVPTAQWTQFSQNRALTLEGALGLRKNVRQRIAEITDTISGLSDPTGDRALTNAFRNRLEQQLTEQQIGGRQHILAGVDMLMRSRVKSLDSLVDQLKMAYPEYSQTISRSYTDVNRLYTDLLTAGGAKGLKGAIRMSDLNDMLQAKDAIIQLDRLEKIDRDLTLSIQNSIRTGEVELSKSSATKFGDLLRHSARETVYSRLHNQLVGRPDITDPKLGSTMGQKVATLLKKYGVGVLKWGGKAVGGGLLANYVSGIQTGQDKKGRPISLITNPTSLQGITILGSAFIGGGSATGRIGKALEHTIPVAKKAFNISADLIDRAVSTPKFGQYRSHYGESGLRRQSLRELYSQWRGNTITAKNRALRIRSQYMRSEVHSALSQMISEQIDSSLYRYSGRITPLNRTNVLRSAIGGITVGSAAVGIPVRDAVSEQLDTIMQNPLGAYTGAAKQLSGTDVSRSALMSGMIALFSERTDQITPTDAAQRLSVAMAASQPWTVPQMLMKGILSPAGLSAAEQLNPDGIRMVQEQFRLRLMNPELPAEQRALIEGALGLQQGTGLNSISSQGALSAQPQQSGQGSGVTGGMRMRQPSAGGVHQNRQLPNEGGVL